MNHPVPPLSAGFSGDAPNRERVELSQHAAEVVDQALATEGGKPGGLLPVLHAVQDALGYIPPESVERIGKALQRSRAEVHGVITFYPHFRQAPLGQHHIEMCRAEACQSMGANTLIEHAAQRLACQPSHTSVDGKFTFDSVYCLGLCAQSPAMMLDGQPYARLTPVRFDRIIEGLDGGEA